MLKVPTFAVHVCQEQSSELYVHVGNEIGLAMSCSFETSCAE